MFTEGLDKNAVRWIREGGGVQHREVPLPANQPSRLDPLRNMRSGGDGRRGFGLPPTSKFRSGHLPSGLVPVARPIPVNGVDSELGSDMEIATDSEDESYVGGRYSLDSSPQSNVEQRYTAVPMSRQSNYASDSVYSEISSSREAFGRQQGNVHKGPVGGVSGRYSAGRHDPTEEDEWSDSAMSSEYTSIQVGSNNVSVPYRGAYTSDGYSSSVPSQPNVVVSDKKDFHVRGLQNKKLTDNEMPTAPPFSGYGRDINQDAEVKLVRTFTTPCTVESNGSSVRNELNTSKTVVPGFDTQDGSGNRCPDQSVREYLTSSCHRTAAGVEGARSFGSLPVRLPNFHASGLGPWYAVISYDACVQLCLHSWARGCMEAPIFLENECALLRDAFGSCKKTLADVEKAVVEALEKQHAEVLSPLKENMMPMKFGLKYVQKLAKRCVCTYVVPEELGILLNSMKRMLDVLRPKIETQLKSWGSCIPDGGNTVPGERLSEITVMLRAKFRNYLQAVVEKLAENTKVQNTTKLKKIIQDCKETVVESDVRSRMQPLKDQLTSTIDQLHSIFETHVFIAICRGYWDRMGQDVLSFLENRKENRSWYKGSRIAVAILDDTYASQMQQLLGNALLPKDLEPPRSIMEVRSMLCKDAPNHKESNYFY